MKSLLVAVLMFGAVAARAQAPADPSPLIQQVAKAAGYLPASWDLNITKKLSIGVAHDAGGFYTIGVRDYFNGQWLAGWGYELFPIKYDGTPRLRSAAAGGAGWDI